MPPCVAAQRRVLSGPDHTPFARPLDQPRLQMGKLRLGEQTHSRGTLVPKSLLLILTQPPSRRRGHLPSSDRTWPGVLTHVSKLAQTTEASQWPSPRSPD